MTKQPEALRLADALDIGHYLPATIAAELRRLHQSETEGWRYADELEQDRKHLADVNADLLEALKALNAGYIQLLLKQMEKLNEKL